MLTCQLHALCSAIQNLSQQGFLSSEKLLILLGHDVRAVLVFFVSRLPHETVAPAYLLLFRLFYLPVTSYRVAHVSLFLRDDKIGDVLAWVVGLLLLLEPLVRVVEIVKEQGHVRLVVFGEITDD